ncbi:monovalent cation/H(+) antiporter subunit G [Desulfosporosinus shakirovi]|uniref:monovalent cation/H(+) antiporter subunit G n=1 Tax=Desulfosporosinus shakirovi TaxID=2885154 RepID=UPI001E334E23|nr:monovalent cation/H(+) antiporter subunit G [Desulfosporosinus sp. SRJS8]MCB8816006.1 monovalent cation/H(+) antiporter subunit G [Desulfosporosinus sp. SRJS8]
MHIDIRLFFTGVFLTIGCFLLLVASIGVIRFPDFFSRMHAAGKADTMGQSSIIIGLIIYSGFNQVSLKLLIIMVMILIINSTATHFLAKAAYMKGVKPWKKGGKNLETDPFAVSSASNVAGKKAKVELKR